MKKQNVIKNILDKIEQNPLTYRFVSNSEIDAWCIKNNICRTIRNYLIENSIFSWVEIGPLSFDSVGKIIEDSKSDISKFLLKNSLLMIGCGVNGDPIVINNDDSNPFTAIVFHDEIEFEENEVPTFIKLKGNIEELFLMANNDKNCPIDAYDAEEKSKFDA